MSNYGNRIIPLCVKEDVNTIKQINDSTAAEVIKEFITDSLHNTTFNKHFGYFLEGFSDSPESQNKKIICVRTALEQLETQRLSNAQQKNIIQSVCDELNKFKTPHLVELCTYCVACIQKGSSTCLAWSEILPELLVILIKRDVVEYNMETMSGLEFKAQLMSSLLMLDWSPNVVIAMANMIPNMPLSKDELTQVVFKLGPYMEKLTPQEIPAFVFQMLKICSKHNGRYLFLYLQNYFGLRIYNNNALASENSESMNIESAIDIETIQAESTVLYHIDQSDPSDKNVINDYLASLNNLTKSPEFILHPFQLTALLSISTYKYHEEKVIKIIKSAMFRSLYEDQKKDDSSWLREMLSFNRSIEHVLTQIIQLSVNDRVLVVQGLITLSFALLESGVQLGKETIIKKEWEYGNLILIKLLKSNGNVAHVIVQKLVDNIIHGQQELQYIKSLYKISKKFAFILLENQGCIINLMDKLTAFPTTKSDEILDALSPLTKKSFTLRDHLILLLKKILYSNSRLMAVNGFLKLIANLKFSNSSALSQSSNSTTSSRSVLSQIVSSASQARSATFTNEALCLEILNMLKMCFNQPAAVKWAMYDGLCEAVQINADLSVPVLEMLWVHFKKYYDEDDDTLPCLKINKVAHVKELDVVLMEPLGKLVYCVAKVLTKASVEHAIVTKFNNVFEKLCTDMGNCEIEHFEFDDGTDLFDILPESQDKMLQLKESISVYESLIIHVIWSWTPESVNAGRKCLKLFEVYNRLLEFSKTITKAKKGDKKNLNKTTQSLNETGKKDAKKSFKPPINMLGFEIVDKCVNLLYTPSLDWTTDEEASVLKKSTAFHQFILNSTINLLRRHKKITFINEPRKLLYYTSCASIATVMYKRCVSTFKESSDFDSASAVLSIEIFYLTLKFIDTNYGKKWSDALKQITDDSTNPLMEILDIYKVFLDSINEEQSMDAESVKFFETVIKTISLLGNKIPVTNNTKYIQLLEWMKQIITHKTIKNKTLITEFLTVMFNMNNKFKSNSTIYKSIADKLNEVLGSISEEDGAQKRVVTEDFTVINESSANQVLMCLCNIIKSLLDDVDWMILRMQSEFQMINYQGEDGVEHRREWLKNKERNVCCQICQIITLVTVLADTSVPPGNYCEAIIKTAIHLFNSLTSLTKYFHARCNKDNVHFQAARFDSAVKQTGKKLSPNIYKLIIFLEQNQNEPDPTQYTKKKQESSSLKTKILKETRLVPKLIYEIEQFSNAVIQLSTKTKVDLSKYHGAGVTRDFRINLNNVLNKDASDCNTSVEDEDHVSVVIDSDGNDSEGEDDDDDGPRVKRTKK